MLQYPVRVESNPESPRSKGIFRLGYFWVCLLAVGVGAGCSRRETASYAGPGVSPGLSADGASSIITAEPGPGIPPIPANDAGLAAASLPPQVSRAVGGATRKETHGEGRNALDPMEGGVEALAIPGFGPAQVSVPTGATGPRRVMIATHGNYDTPEWTCRIWREVTRAEFFILCPRGVPRADSPSPQDIVYQYSSARALEQEIEAGLAAIQSRWSAYISKGPMIYAGFSQGAIMGVGIVLRNPGKYPRVALVEGGFENWTSAKARAFVQGGGERLLLACGQWNCENAGLGLSRRLQGAGAQVKVVVSRGAGHTYGGAVAEALQESFPWLREGWQHETIEETVTTSTP